MGDLEMLAILKAEGVEEEIIAISDMLMPIAIVDAFTAIIAYIVSEGDIHRTAISVGINTLAMGAFGFLLREMINRKIV